MTSIAATSLDSLDYDPLTHLNAIFSHPSTLTSVPVVSQSLRTYQTTLDSEIASLVANQAASDAASISRVQTAQNDLSNLFTTIAAVQTRAASTETTISDMTADIKRLDRTKRNLTLSMTALKRLQMLTTAYEQLDSLRDARQYRECAGLLAAVLQLMAHFKSFRSVDAIAALGRAVADTQRALLEQVCEDFELAYARGEVDSKRGMLSEGCLVMDALGENLGARGRLVTWYCNTQLREYRALFKASDEAGNLDNIARRYAWFKRLLKNFDERDEGVFPREWRVDEVLANAFCEGTRDDFKTILSRAVKGGSSGSAAQTQGQGQGGLDPNLLLSCLQETLDFEQSLERRFVKDSRASVDTTASLEEQARKQPWAHAMSEAFEPYLSVWIEAQDKMLDGMISKYRSQPALGAEETFGPQMVITTSTELFSVYRSLLAQCLKLSTGQQLVELSKVFGKYLGRYAQQVLLYYISEKPTGQTPSRLPSAQDIVLVLNTADYCYSTSTQLEERIKTRVDEKFREEVDMETQADEFMGIANAAVRSLVRKIELELEPTWRAMRNVGWARMETVGDQSPYVAEITTRLREQVSEYMDMIHKQQYARAFCDNVVELLATAFTANTMQSKPISEVGAEQLQVDLMALTEQAGRLINVNASEDTRAPAGYIKRVTQTMSRVTPLLKVLQVRPSPPESLAEAYLLHVADKSDTNFRKVLDLKGVRKQDQAQFMEIFVAHKSATRHASLPTQSTFLTPLMVMTSTPGAISGLANLPSARAPSLPGIFDGGAIGNAFLSGVKDSVDMLGTPSLSIAGSRNPSPHPASGAGTADGAVNQNLRNIGKFFKRDLSGFGGRFGQKSEDAPK